MVAINRAYPFNDYPDSTLPEDVLADVVNLRARGHSWESTALAVGYLVVDLRRAARHDPNFPAALELARKEIEQEAEAETLRTLRAQLNDTDAKAALKAAQILTKYLAEKRRDETRLEVERLRAEARIAREQARANNQPAEEAADPNDLTPEEHAEVLAHWRQIEADRAEKLAREGAIIYLWGGCHKLGDTPPDATDTPLRLTCTTIDARPVYWAYTDPPPTANPFEGPFLAPPGCRPTTYPFTEGTAPS